MGIRDETRFARHRAIKSACLTPHTLKELNMLPGLSCSEMTLRRDIEFLLDTGELNVAGSGKHGAAFSSVAMHAIPWVRNGKGAAISMLAPFEAAAEINWNRQIVATTLSAPQAILELCELARQILANEIDESRQLEAISNVEELFQFVLFRLKEASGMLEQLLNEIALWDIGGLKRLASDPKFPSNIKDQHTFMIQTYVQGRLPNEPTPSPVGSDAPVPAA